MTVLTRGIWSICCLLGAAMAAPNLAHGSEVPVSVLVHRSGAVTTVADATVAARVAAEAEQFFVEADGKPRLILDGRRIERLTSRGDAIELKYSTAQTREVLGRPVTFDHLLIPLGSDDVPDGLVLYAGPGETFATGRMVTNSKGTTSLRLALEARN